MLVLGCSPHNYNSVWVKNEWNRFLELRKNNSGKVIIPCYKNCSPYELPRELAVFQALDMNKIGFLQEVIAGIRKIVSEESATEELSDVNRLCKNAETFYNLGDKKKAEEIYIDLTNNYPDDYRGWWGAASVKTDRFRLYSWELFQQIEGVVNNAFQVAKTSEREQIQPVWDAYLVLREERKLEEEKQKNKLHYQKYTERIENDKSQLEDARKRRAFYESEYPTDGSRLKSLCEERAAREDAIRKIQEDEKRLSGPTNAGNKVRKLGWIIGIGFCVFLLGGNFLSNIGNDIGFSGWLQAIIGSVIIAAILIGIAFAVAGAMDGAVMGKNKLAQNNLNKQQKREEEALKSIVKEINVIEPRKQEYDKVCALITRLEEDIKSAENDRSKLQGRM